MIESRFEAANKPTPYAGEKPAQLLILRLVSPSRFALSLWWLLGHRNFFVDSLGPSQESRIWNTASNRQSRIKTRTKLRHVHPILSKKTENSFAAIILLRRSTVQQLQNMPMEPNQLVVLPRLKGVSQAPRTLQQKHLDLPLYLKFQWDVDQQINTSTTKVLFSTKMSPTRMSFSRINKSTEKQRRDFECAAEKTGGLGKNGLGNFMLNSRFQNWDSVWILDPGYRVVRPWG